MRLARWWLGILLTAMALGQLSDPQGFADILATYDVLPSSFTLMAGLAIAAVELGGGVGLLAGRRHVRWASRVTGFVAIGWAVLAVQAFARGLVIANCGCFGVHLGQTLWWGVLVQDAAFVSSAVWLARRAGRPDGAGVPDDDAAPTTMPPRRRAPRAAR